MLFHIIYCFNLPQNVRLPVSKRAPVTVVIILLMQCHTLHEWFDVIRIAHFADFAVAKRDSENYVAMWSCMKNEDDDLYLRSVFGMTECKFNFWYICLDVHCSHVNTVFHVEIAWDSTRKMIVHNFINYFLFSWILFESTFAEFLIEIKHFPLDTLTFNSNNFNQLNMNCKYYYLVTVTICRFKLN